jgi:hypothetical protein
MEQDLEAKEMQQGSHEGQTSMAHAARFHIYRGLCMTGDYGEGYFFPIWVTAKAGHRSWAFGSARSRAGSARDSEGPSRAQNPGPLRAKSSPGSARSGPLARNFFFREGGAGLLH